MATKLEQIAALDDGWWGPGSLAVSPSAIELVRHLMPTLAKLGAHVAIAPHDSGSLILEWSSDDIEYSVELLRDGAMVLTVDDEPNDQYREVTVEASETRLRDFVEAT